MSETPATEPSFTAVGVVTSGGRQLASSPFTFDRSGVHLILQKAAHGGFEVIQAQKVEPGTGRFEKTVIEPVVFLVHRDGAPYWKVEVKGMFDSMKLDLNG